ncbi:Ltp family lipoprotein [Bogoriella caseilytica]|uniref:Ltp family lipoprotein n=1 Tax=Bogoriella caseilytica TaxID=56055 RepID=UPI001473EAE3|nr:Ltp family lipoprotein [Bogoriella caseilytica]
MVGLFVALGVGIAIGNAGSSDSEPLADSSDEVSQEEFADLEAERDAVTAAMEEVEAERDAANARADEAEEALLLAELEAVEAAAQAASSEPEEEDDEPAEDEAAQGEDLSLAQRNAIGSAESYLSFTHFSRSGLISQLEYEDFSTDDATFAVDYIDPDWNEQAAGSAESYLEFTSFSRQGLIDQLLYEGFSQSEAEYGVEAVGY